MRKRNIKKVKIGYADFKIRHLSKRTSSRKLEDMGELDYGEHTITIFGKQADSEYMNTMLHEFFHAMNWVFNIPYKSAKQEEEYVKMNTSALITLFKDNPELLDTIKEHLQTTK
jgi:hypothetical protein